MKKITSLFLVMMLGILVCTQASASQLDFFYNNETRTLNIEGSLGSSEHQPCMVYVYDASDSSADISDSNPPVFADVIVTGKDGRISYTKILSDTYSSGEYRVTAASAEGTQSKEFMYSNPNSVTDLLPLINGASDARLLEGVITPNTGELGIDDSLYMPIKDKVCEYLFSSKPDGGFANASAFINTLDQCIMSVRINKGESVPVLLKDNASVVKINFENDYNKFDTSVKEAINTELKNANYNTKLFSEFYPELRTIAFMKSAPTWQALKNAFFGVDVNGNLIVSNYSVINPDVSDYNSVVNKDDVFAEMFKQRASLTTVPAIRKAFADCALSVYTLEQSGGQSAGGSTGGGVSSGPVAITPGYVNQGTTAPKSNLFDDVAYTDWYFASVEKLVVNKLINGYEDGTFRPENPITRAEFTKLIVGVADHLAIELGVVSSDASFEDVALDAWYAGYVAKAAKSGLVMGSEGKFSPDNKITRQDASVILYRLVTKVKTLTGDKTFTDDGAIADYAKEAVSGLATANIISGMTDGTFAPASDLTRAQAAKLLAGVLEYLN